MSHNAPHPSSSTPSSHWCQSVLEESNLHNPLAAPAPPPLHQQMQQQPLASSQYQSAPNPYYSQQYQSTSYQPTQTYQYGAAAPVQSTMSAPTDYHAQQYDPYRYNLQHMTSTPYAPVPNNAGHPHMHSNYLQGQTQPSAHVGHYQSQGTPQSYAAAVSQKTSNIAQAHIHKSYPSTLPSAESSLSWRPPPANSAPPALSETAPVVASSTGLKKPSRFSANPPAAVNTNQPSANKAASTGPAKGGNAPVFPPSLKAYVERAFASCKTDADRKVIEVHLKDIIGRVTSDGRLHKHRWDVESIPRLNVAPPVTQSPRVDALKSQNHSGQQIMNNQFNVNENTKKRKSRFSAEANWSSSPTSGGEYGYNPNRFSSSVPSPKQNKKGKSNSSIYGPGLSPKIMSIYGPSSSEVSREDAISRESRAQRFSTSDDDRLNVYGPSSGKTKKGKNKSKGHQNQLQKPSPPVIQAPIVPLTEEDLENMKVVGTCQNLEKDYFRLTSAPDPSTVRPEHVLRQSLNFVKNKWNSEKNTNKEINSYILSQFKSMRQDLTLQHISNDLTVEVYESHARIELEKGDLNEYNQCQTQLKQLYAAGLGGSEMEFIAYRILYYLYLQGNKKYQGGSQDLLHVMASLTDEAMVHPSVSHALAVRRALLQDNYHRFFALYKNTPSLGTCILDLMVGAYRFKCLQRMFKTYKPSIDEKFVIKELGFDTEETGRSFLHAAGCLPLQGTDDTNTVLDTKNSTLIAPQDDSGLLL